MYAMRILLVALIPVAEAFLNPNNSQLISRGPDRSANIPYLERSNTACSGHCESGWTYFDGTDACYKTILQRGLVIGNTVGLGEGAWEGFENYEDTALFPPGSDDWIRFACDFDYTQNFFWATMDDAESLCRTLGGHLASVHSFAENALIAELSKTGKAWTDWLDTTWIGLRRPGSKGNWTWTDGTKVDFLNWAPDEPNDWHGIQHCASVQIVNAIHRECRPSYRFPCRCPLTPAPGKLEGRLVCDPNNSLPQVFRKWDDLECSAIVRAFVCKKNSLH